MDLRSGVPLWPWRDGMLATYPPLTRDERADVVVIGAGITGALVARALVDAGAEVVVVDKRDVAAGSSAATSGLLMHETDTHLRDLASAVGEPAAHRAWMMGLEAIDHLEQMIGTLDDSCGFARRDTLYLASTRRDARRLRDECDYRRRLGFSADWIEPASLRSQYGLAAHGAIRSDGNGQVNCYRLTHRVLQSALARGARVFDRTEITRVDSHESGVTIHVAGGPSIRSRRVVWATGYEALEDIQRRLARLRSTWVVASEPVTGEARWRNDALIWESARPYLYARVTDDGRVLLGGEDEGSAERHANERVMKKKSKRLVSRFARLRPDAAPVEPAYRWSGTFAETKDGLPYIGTVPEHPHAWLALGYGGNGITFSTIASQLIRDEWAGRRNPDSAIYSFMR